MVLVPYLHWKLTWTNMWCHQFEFPVNGNIYLNIYFLPKKKGGGEPWMSSWYWLSAQNQLPYLCVFAINLACLIYAQFHLRKSWKILLDSIIFLLCIHNPCVMCVQNNLSIRVYTLQEIPFMEQNQYINLLVCLSLSYKLLHTSLPPTAPRKKKKKILITRKKKKVKWICREVNWKKIF